MIVCHCKGLSDRDIKAASRPDSPSSCRDVGRTCGAGTVCKGCVPTIRAVLEAHKQDGPHRPTTPTRAHRA